MKRQDILLIIVFTFIIILAWTGFSFYHRAVTSTLSEVQQIEIKPITPDFDAATIQKLRARKTVAPLMTAQPGAPVASSSAQQASLLSPQSLLLKQTPIASSSGQAIQGQ